MIKLLICHFIILYRSVICLLFICNLRIHWVAIIIIIRGIGVRLGIWAVCYWYLLVLVFILTHSLFYIIYYIKYLLEKHNKYINKEIFKQMFKCKLTYHYKSKDLMVFIILLYRKQNQFLCYFGSI